jgi:hypothetical protein
MILVAANIQTSGKQGGMPPVQQGENKPKALIAYFESLRQSLR